MFDVIIKNGTIIDGTGEAMYRGDVGIRDDEIIEIGDLSNEKTQKEIDAFGKYVTPGFIDINNHSDTKWRIFANPSLESLLHQGITTIIGGNCGSSLAPLNNYEMIKAIRKWLDVTKINVNWISVEEFLKEVERVKLSVNFGTLVGHGTIRRGLVGDSVRDLEKVELKEMNKIIKESLKEGVLGVSAGLVYSHAKLASKQELEEIANIISDHKRVFAVHLRDETDSILQSLDEVIDVAKNSGVKLQVSHLKVMGEKNWPLMDKVLRKIEKADEEGVDIYFDVYPYVATGSVLYTFLPDWVSRGGRKLMLSRLKDSEIRKKVIKEMKEGSIDYSKIMVSSGSLEKMVSRRNVSDIAKSQNKSVEETVIDLLIAGNGQIITITKVLSEDNLDKAISHPLSIISSNGAGYEISHKSSGDLIHPRDFGSFPRVLSRYVKDKSLLEWEEAVYKMTGLPATRYDIDNRGVIKRGNFADVLVIDPETIKDSATVDNPYQYSSGIDYVLVNGKITVEEGKYVGERAGRIVKD